MFEYDITFCGNKEKCPNAGTCWRAAALPPGIYTYSLFYKEGEKCEYYWETKNEENLSSNI